MRMWLYIMADVRLHKEATLLRRHVKAHILTTRRMVEETGSTEKAITMMLRPEDAAKWVLNQD